MATVEVETALRYYKNHLKNVSEYQKRHPDKMREKNREYNKRIREEHPEKYHELLAKKKEYYQTVRKPLLDAKKKSSPKNDEPVNEKIVIGGHT
jgi:hypothetical protein